MQIAQFNPIRFFADKNARQWERSEIDGSSNEFHVVFYPTGVVPTFCLLIPTEPQVAVPNADIYLYNSDDELVYTIESLGINGFGTYAQVIYSGATLTNKSEGYYYLKAVIGSDTFYSDVFAWTNDTSELMKFEVASSDVWLNDMVFNMMAASTQTFYLNGRKLAIKPKIDQDGNDQNAITHIVWGSRAIQREYDIDACESTYIYLSALAMLKSNGLVNITSDYETFTASDIVVEESTNHNNGLYQVKLTFVDENETVSVRNI